MRSSRLNEIFLPHDSGLFWMIRHTARPKLMTGYTHMLVGTPFQPCFRGVTYSYSPNPS